MKRTALIVASLAVMSLVIVISVSPPATTEAPVAMAPPETVNDQGVVHSEPRSPKWPAVRKKYLSTHPACAACGTMKQVEVHHVKPFHVHPELELVESNLIGLCRGPATGDHHFTVGHDPDGPAGPKSPNWSMSNPNVRADAERLRKKLNPKGN